MVILRSDKHWWGPMDYESVDRHVESVDRHAAKRSGDTARGSGPLLFGLGVFCTVVLIAFRTTLKHAGMLLLASTLPLLSPLRVPPAAAAFALGAAFLQNSFTPHPGIRKGLDKIGLWCT